MSSVFILSRRNLGGGECPSASLGTLDSKIRMVGGAFSIVDHE